MLLRSEKRAKNTDTQNISNKYFIKTLVKTLKVFGKILDRKGRIAILHHTSGKQAQSASDTLRCSLIVIKSREDMTACAMDY